MLIDETTIIVKAGDGGNGAATFRRNAQTAKGGPDGGNGGKGGDVYFQGSTNIFDLKEFQFKKKVIAPDGIRGKKQLLFGKNGEDITVLVPLGTQITDIETGETVEIIKKDQRICLAKGGKGGRGNNEFKSATEQTPMFAEKGEPGEQKTISLVLKSIADVGLVGFPNAGKSTMLSLLTNATPKIGDYAFTTIDPNLGVWENWVIADIPGIIKGASAGRGLGIKFLKHIEKTKMLFYCIAATDTDPFKTYSDLREEFRAYEKKLLEKPEVILLTKIDLVDEKKIEDALKAFAGKDIIAVSQNDPESIQRVVELLKEKIKN